MNVYFPKKIMKKVQKLFTKQPTTTQHDVTTSSCEYGRRTVSRLATDTGV